MKACVLFRDSVAYRREVFRAGLVRLGYDIVERPLVNPDKDDLLCMWNRSPHEEAYARNYERAGAKLIVCENGYIGKDEQGHKLFAMSLNHHNGAGTWKIGGASDRWKMRVIPWRENGDFLLVLPQREVRPAIKMGIPPTIISRISDGTRR